MVENRKINAFSYFYKIWKLITKISYSPPQILRHLENLTGSIGDGVFSYSLWHLSQVSSYLSSSPTAKRELRASQVAFLPSGCSHPSLGPPTNTPFCNLNFLALVVPTGILNCWLFQFFFYHYSCRLDPHCVSHAESCHPFPDGHWGTFKMGFQNSLLCFIIAI